MTSAEKAIYTGGALEIIGLTSMYISGDLGWDMAAKCFAFVAIVGFSILFLSAPIAIANSFHSDSDDGSAQ